MATGKSGSSVTDKVINAIHGLLGGGENKDDKMAETIFDRHKAAMDAKIDADSNGQDGNSAYKARMGLKD